MSKRTLAVTMCLAVLVGGMTSTAEAGKKKPKPRTEEASYIAGPFVYHEASGVGGASFPTAASETYVDVEVTDLSGQPAPGLVGQDVDGDNSVDGQFFCGSIDNVAITPGYDVTVFIFTSPVCIPDLSPGLGTTGTMKVTFSSVP